MSANRFLSVLPKSIVLLLGLCFGAMGADSSSAAQHEIRAALEAWTLDFNSGNSAEVCSLFAPDLISNYQGQPEGNFDSLCARLKKSLADRVSKYHYDLRINEIIVSGDLAVVRLEWTLKVHRQEPPRESTIEEPGLDIFRRQPDRAWKIARYMAYPLATSAPN